MWCSYIYLISFKNTNDIYIGKTECSNVYERLTCHFSNFLQPPCLLNLSG